MDPNGSNGAYGRSLPDNPIDGGIVTNSAVRQSKVFSLGNVVECTRRHKWKVAFFGAVTMAAAGALAIVWPKTYRSEAKLYVRLGRENIGLDATSSMGREIVAVQMTREEELNTHVELLRSRSMLEKVVESAGPDAILSATAGLVPTQPSWFSRILTLLEESVRRMTDSIPLTPKEKAINVLNRQLDVQNVRKTDVIVVAHEGPIAKVSQRIVEILVNAYLDEHGRISRPPGAYAFLETQAAGIKEKLVRTENELRLFKDATGLASPAEQRQTLVSQIGRIEDDLKSTSALTSATAAENRELLIELAKLAPVDLLNKSTGNTNFAADGMRQQLYTLQLKEKELASRLTDHSQNAELQLVRAQIASARLIVDSLEPTRTQLTTGPNRTYEDLQLALLRQKGALASQRAKSSTLVAQLADAKQQLRSLNDNEMRIAELQREAHILDASYRKYTESLEHARLDESLERQRISNISVAQAPSLSMQPVRPQRSLFLLVGLVLVLFGGPLVALASDHFQAKSKLRRNADYRVNLPMMTSISPARESHPVGNIQA
jgi:uncharacterized protein involved in exopolysaccharide biosynthesis